MFTRFEEAITVALGERALQVYQNEGAKRSLTYGEWRAVVLVACATAIGSIIKSFLRRIVRSFGRARTVTEHTQS